MSAAKPFAIDKWRVYEAYQAVKANAGSAGAGLARLHNPILRGWLQYYGQFHRSAMYPVLRHFNQTLVAWAMRKYRRLRGHKVRAAIFLENIAEKQPHLFVHWQRGMVGAFA